MHITEFTFSVSRKIYSSLEGENNFEMSTKNILEWSETKYSASTLNREVPAYGDILLGITWEKMMNYANHTPYLNAY